MTWLTAVLGKKLKSQYEKHFAHPSIKSSHVAVSGTATTECTVAECCTTTAASLGALSAEVAAEVGKRSIVSYGNIMMLSVTHGWPQL